MMGSRGLPLWRRGRTSWAEPPSKESWRVEGSPPASEVDRCVFRAVPMIHPYSNVTLNQWSRGELQVQILLPASDRPIAYCDGTREDEAELQRIAEGEGTELPTIHRKVLKTGREIWTIGEPPVPTQEEED